MHIKGSILFIASLGHNYSGNCFWSIESKTELRYSQLEVMISETLCAIFFFSPTSDFKKYSLTLITNSLLLELESCGSTQIEVLENCILNPI